VRRFKGLESEIVILWGLEAVPTELASELLYVALSRARLRVWLVEDALRQLDEILSSADQYPGTFLRLEACRRLAVLAGRQRAAFRAALNAALLPRKK
jgi:superfamily I DNA/RNA helicase